MGDAPERIWVDFEPRDWPSERIMYGDMPEPYAEYIRADLAAPDLAELVEALETAHECLLWCAREGRMASPNLSRYPERWADNLALKLAKIKEPQT